MKNFQNLEDFLTENPDAQLLNAEAITGAKGEPVSAQTISNESRNTMTQWNCADREQRLLYEGKVASDWYSVYEEQP